MTIDPLTEIVLRHPVRHIDVAESGHMAAISPKGSGSLISPDHTEATSFRVSFDPNDLAIATNGSLLAVTGGSGLTIISTSTLRPIHRLDDSFESAHFTSNGLLWCSARIDTWTIALEVRDSETWRTIARAEVTDPFGDSDVKLLPHPDCEYVVMWAAAGQDGQCLFWVRYDGSAIVVEPFPDLEEGTWPSFNPAGNEFLVVAEAGELHRYKFPRGPLLASMQWPFDPEDSQIGDLVSFVDASRALVASNEGRLYLVDLNRMAIEDEIRIRGHEPKPAVELYPSLGEGRGLWSDLSFFLPVLPGRFLSIHRELPSLHSDENHDHLLTWRIGSSQTG